MVLIILLSASISKVMQTETSFVLDFTGYDELQQQLKELQVKAQAEQELEEMLSGSRPAAVSGAYRNVAVDRSGSELRDDRFDNPSQVYDEARELQRKLDESRRQAEMEQGSDDVAVPGKKVESTSETYKGPSVISYTLDGRRAISLPVPVYKCYGGGDVSVRITVNRKGYVTAASVIESVSSTDECLIRSALDAANRSRFRASSTAPERQVGEIVYRFIAQ
ncbi:MAG: energy transducer TonB [Bacteroidetes bacterium]|uniref:Energy transducer TonB n=1 Tax=Candidatus Egerieousia excrementavium TaxID=2840778 RepID=A0A9D9DK80_9BACT|nr:energy transducer TonB [Candidatus Egerieousia excrementavium]